MSFNIALSGLNAASTDLNVISNNIANANTTGFKDSRAEFGDLVEGSVYSVAGVAVGNGVSTETVSQQFAQGTITSTNNPLDLALNGNGFFALSDNGTSVFTRNGEFTTDKNGFVVNGTGMQLLINPVATTSPVTFASGTFQPLQILPTPNPPSATQNLTAGVTLPVGLAQPSVGTFDPTNPNSYNATSTMTIYDSLGEAHSVGLYFVQGSTAGNWTLHTVVDGTELAPPLPALPGTALAFDNSGILQTPPGGIAALPSFNPTDGAAQMTMKLDVSKMVQYGSAFTVNSLTQDGYTTGNLSGVQISQSGVVTANYTNGRNVPLGQIALANFANPQGLQQLGNATWASTFDSGQALYGSAGTSNFGALQSGSLEASNTDLTAQLVDMMTAQRNYQANSQVISTQDQLLQTILQLR